MSAQAVERRAVCSVLGKKGLSPSDIQLVMLAKPKLLRDYLSLKQIEATLKSLEARGEVRCRDGLWCEVPAEDWPELTGSEN